MVRGRAMAVTAVALMYQSADTTRMARGLGTDAPPRLGVPVLVQRIHRIAVPEERRRHRVRHATTF
jgi:hypothetical protein